MQLHDYILRSLQIKSDQTSEDLIKSYVEETKQTGNLLPSRTAIVEAISKLLIEQKIYKKFSQHEHSFGQTIYYLNGNLQSQSLNTSLANLELRQVVTLALAELLVKFQEKCLRIQVINLAFLCYKLSSKGTCYKQLNILAEKGFLNIVAKPGGPIKLSYPIGTSLNFLNQTEPVEYARIVAIAKEQIKFEDAELDKLVPTATREFVEKVPEVVEEVPEVIEELLTETRAEQAISSFFSEYETLLQHVVELKENNDKIAQQMQSIQTQLCQIKSVELEEIAICRYAGYVFSEQDIKVSWVYNLSTGTLVELNFNCPDRLLSLSTYREVAYELRLEIEKEISTKSYLNDSSVKVFQQVKPSKS